MSGICGLVDFSGRPIAPEVLMRIAEAARHRGPDGIRYRVQGATAFCHLALNATAEAACEHQPLSTPDGAVWLAADLRLDNREDLLRSLEPSGLLPTGRTVGDGEIVLAAFLTWGKSCVERLLGDFAFAVWDGRSRTLLCARDPLGVKPLCYARVGSLFCFASEAQQILHHPAVDKSFDERSLADHLAGCSQDTGRSFFRQVNRLPPGHRLTAGAQSECLERTWAPEWIEEDSRITRQDAVTRFREVFQEAVGARLRTSRSRIGIALSGGLDSTSVATVAQRQLLGSQRAALLSYSFVFDSLTDCDERAYIRPLAESQGFEAAFIPAENHWLLTAPAFHEVSLESPHQGWLSCHLAGMGLLEDRGARVLLTGQGADDLLQGSPLVLAQQLLRGRAQVVADVWRHSGARGLYRRLLRPVLPLGLDAGMRRALRRPLPPRVPDWVSPACARRTGVAERAADPPFGPWRGMAQSEVRSHLALAPYEQTIHWQERIAAAFGIEVRHPFLDRRIAELVLAIPAGRLFELGRYKSLLRDSVAGILPDALRLRRDKTKLGAYVDTSLRKKAGSKIEVLLESPLSAELGLVDGAVLRSAFRAYQQGDSRAELRKIWYAVTLELWLRRHLAARETEPAPTEPALTSVS